MRIMLSGVKIEGGGAEQVIQDLARGFAGRGHEVMVAFLEGPDGVVPDLEAAGIRCERLMRRTDHVTSSVLADFNPSCILAFHRLVSQFAPDVWHVHIPRPALWASFAYRFIRRRPAFIYTEHNVQEVLPTWARFVYRCFLPVVDAVVCVSDGSRDSFANHWTGHSIPERIWNGIRPDRVASTRERDDVRHDLGIGGDIPVLCNVANVSYRKGHDILVQALHLLAREVGEDFACLIAGNLKHEPWTVEALRQQIVELGLEQNVQILGFRDDVPDLLAAADVFVLSSRQEGMPISILEAMAARKPVVATDVGGCAEPIAHDETGLIVPPESPEALGQALISLLSDRERAQTMGAAGRERVEREFTVDRMVEQHLALYDRLLAQSSA